MQCECTVTPIGWYFLYNQQQPSAGEGEVANFREFSEKNHNFNNHTVYLIPSNKGFYIDIKRFKQRNCTSANIRQEIYAEIGVRITVYRQH